MRYKWRLFLAVFGILLTLALNVLALRQWETAHAEHPGAFYHGNMGWQPPAIVIRDCISAPAFFLWNTARHFATNGFGLNSEWFWPSGRAYMLGVASFWWCIGWALDRYFAQNRLNRAGAIVVAISTAALMYLAISSLIHNAYFAPYVSAAGIVWSFLLFVYLAYCYFQDASVNVTSS